MKRGILFLISMAVVLAGCARKSAPKEEDPRSFTCFPGEDKEVMCRFNASPGSDLGNYVFNCFVNDDVCKTKPYLIKPGELCVGIVVCIPISLKKEPIKT